MSKNYFFLILLVFGFQTAGAASKAIDINAAIKKAGAQWKANDNWLTELPPNQLKMMMGVQMPDTKSVEFTIQESGKNVSQYPPVLDWRNKDGKNWVSPILNQANCGSCVAFASIGVLETQYKISAALPWLNIKLSPQHLFSCGGGGCNRGWQIYPAAKYLMTKGVPDESCMPYTSGATSNDVACNKTCNNTAQRSIKIASYKAPTTLVKNLDAIRAALQKGPLVTTMIVYGDFVAYSSGIYKHVTGASAGGHAISIVGYDDFKQAFIIRNSWGPDWGENGFGYVAYDDNSGVGSMTLQYEMPAFNGAVSIASPTDYTYFTGHIPFKASSTFEKTNNLNVQIYNGANKQIWASTCGQMSSNSCDQNIEIASMTDGRYEILAQAIDADGKVLGQSTRQIFYVANNEPELKLSYTGMDDLDLSKPLRGRIEFAVDSQSSTVPMSSIDFHFVGSDGKDHKKTVTTVTEGLTMGWRTNMVPNGVYQIWMVGHVRTNGFDKTVQTEKITVTINN